MRRILFSPLLCLITFSYAQEFTVSSLGLAPPPSIRCTPVKNQSMSSTCWSFAGNSLLESELINIGKGNFDLSEMFVARYSMLRKIRRHLMLGGKNYFTPGGQFHDQVWVLKNYGMVPESVYSGKAQGEFYHNHRELDTVLSRYVRGLLYRGVQVMDAVQEYFVDSVLDYYLGKVPKTFNYNNKTYTPKSFLKQVLQFNPDDYLEITSYTHHPFYQPFVLEDKYNWTGDAYYNVPVSDFSRITDYALEQGYTVGWDGDADDPGFFYNEGLAYLPGAVQDIQTTRQKAFENQSTLLDHMMHIVGVVKDIHGQKWYYIKNSWGVNSNSLGGFIYMRDDYFKIRTPAIIVNKKAIPTDILKKLKLPPHT